ncbi:unnamed protein product [marine sediment metagenome]|uniref:Uncharacterized protein n=1 Tax=marine sediment metagenome TaxID=412755 RepID=X0V799_9ZZZZ
MSKGEVTAEESGFQHKWDRSNHDWSGGSRDGYAVCRNCDTTENTPEAATACIVGPATEFGRNVGIAGVDTVVRAAVKAETERCCAHLCHLCKEHGAPVKVQGYWRHDVAGGSMSFGCFAAAIRGKDAD